MRFEICSCLAYSKSTLDLCSSSLYSSGRALAVGGTGIASLGDCVRARAGSFLTSTVTLGDCSTAVAGAF